MIAVRVEEMITRTDYTLVVGQHEYTLPEDWIGMAHVEIVDASDTNRTWRLYPMSIKEYHNWSRGSAQTNQEPFGYRLEVGPLLSTQDPQRVGELILYPAPDAADTMQVWYYRKPADVSAGTNIVELPLHYHEAVCQRVAQMLAIKGKEYQLADRLLREYELTMREITQSAKNMKRRDHIAKTKDTMGYGAID